MKYVIALLLVPFAFSASAKSDSHPLCQAKLLKLTSQAFHDDLPKSIHGVHVISQITFNYGLVGRPRIVMMSRRNSDSSRVCLIEVYANIVGNDEDGCPGYIFESIESNCD